MAILSGSLTVRRFRIEGDMPEDWREVYKERLNEFAFHQPPNAMGKEEIEGWVQIHNLLDTQFDDLNQWLYNNYAIFALRVDKKRLPAKLFKATLQKRCEAWCREREVERCPAAVKSEIKEMLEQEWLKQTLPSVGLTEICWNVNDRYLILHSLSEASADRFRKRFHRTFGLTAVPWSPLDYAASMDLAEALIGKAPTLSVPQED